MNNKLKNIGLGILSWKGYESLTASLESYKKNGLAELFTEKIIYFNEIDSTAKSIAKKYGFKAHGNEKNEGIYGGFRGLAKAMQSKYILLLENDWQLTKPPAETKRQLEISLKLLQQGRAIKIWCRERTDVIKQNKNNSTTFYKFFPPKNSSLAARLRAFFYRLFFFNRKRKVMIASLFYMERPQDKFNFAEYDEAIDFFFCPSKYQHWSNNPLMIERDFFINEILARAEKIYVPKKYLVNGFRNLETEMTNGHVFINPILSHFYRLNIFSRSWWESQNFKIATANSGLFTHNRLGDRGY